jgi:hypothetical protein
MFGYMQPLKPELKVKENEAFGGYYCGLCKAIKENYTNTARFMLNYDCAFLSLLLSSMSEEAPEVFRERCAASPFKEKTVIRSRESAYAAAVNVLLGYAKIKDSVIDERKLSALLLSGLYKGVARRAAGDFAALSAELAARMDALRGLEKRKCADIDEVSSEFGGFLAAVFSMAPFGFTQGSQGKALWHFGYNLGRWIYIADALSDMVRDDKKGSYNVFLQRDYTDASELRKKAGEEMAFNLNISLAESCNAYELLDIKRDKPLIDNIMYLGLAKKTEDILS